MGIINKLLSFFNTKRENKVYENKEKVNDLRKYNSYNKWNRLWFVTFTILGGILNE